MSGLFGTVGFAREVVASVPTPTAGTGAAGPPALATLTFGSAHGIAKGSKITLTGFTPSTWNGTFTVASVPSATTLTFPTSTTLATATVMGTATATNWGGGGTVTRFFEHTSELLKSNPGRIQGTGIRAGDQVDSANRMVVYLMDSAGDLVIDAWDKGMGILMEMGLGTVVVTGPNSDGYYTHTYTIGDLRGKSLVGQFGIPDGNGVVYPFTFAGLKITKLVIANNVDQLLTFTFTFDGLPEKLTVALAAPSWASGPNLLSFIGGSVVADSVAYDVLTGVTITINNNTATKRRFLGGSQKKEQLLNAKRTITTELDYEFNGLGFYNKFAATTPSGSTAAISVGWLSPVTVGSTTGSFTVNMPAVRIDGDTPTLAGPDLVQLKSTGPALNSAAGTNDAINIVYVTTDSAP